jgi:hypothetical protein
MRTRKELLEELESLTSTLSDRALADIVDSMADAEPLYSYFASYDKSQQERIDQRCNQVGIAHVWKDHQGSTDWLEMWILTGDLLKARRMLS